MRNLDRRLSKLEAERQPSGWGTILDTMDDESIFRLERLNSRLLDADDADAEFLTLDPADRAFLAELLEQRGVSLCAA